MFVHFIKWKTNRPTLFLKSLGVYREEATMLMDEERRVV